MLLLPYLARSNLFNMTDNIVKHINKSVLLEQLHPSLATITAKTLGNARERDVPDDGGV